MHLLLWKHIVFQLTQVETENARFETHEIWQATWARFEKKALAKQENVRTLILRADSRGDEPPDLENKAAPLAPIATFDEGGIVLWDEKVKHEINRLATTPTSTRRRSRQ